MWMSWHHNTSIPKMKAKFRAGAVNNDVGGGEQRSVRGVSAEDLTGWRRAIEANE